MRKKPKSLSIRKIRLSKEKQHNILVDKIFDNPELLGIAPDTLVTKEKHFPTGDGSYHIIDLIFVYEIGHIYEILGIEVTSHGISHASSHKNLYSANNYFQKDWKTWFDRIEIGKTESHGVFFDARVALQDYDFQIKVDKPFRYKKNRLKLGIYP